MEHYVCLTPRCETKVMYIKVIVTMIIIVLEIWCVVMTTALLTLVGQTTSPMIPLMTVVRKVIKVSGG